MPDDFAVDYVPPSAEDAVLSEGAAFLMGKTRYYNLKYVSGSKDRAFLLQTRISKDIAGEVSRL